MRRAWAGLVGIALALTPSGVGSGAFAPATGAPRVAASDVSPERKTGGRRWSILSGLKNFSLRRMAAADPDDAERKDWEVATRARAALSNDPDLAEFNLEVDVENGILTLRGPVPSEYYRIRANELARGVKGVKTIRNQIRVRPVPPPKAPPFELFAPVEAPMPRPALGVPRVRLGASGPPEPRPQARAQEPEAPLAWKPIISNPNDRPMLLPPKVEHRKDALVGRPPAPPKPGPPGAGLGSSDPKEASALTLAFSVERLLKGNTRFQRVSFSLRGEEVHLIGVVASPAELDDLVRALSNLWGVRAVRSEQVAVGGR